MGQHPHRATDWASQPVNNILCDGHKPGRHEWVSTMCATATDKRQRFGTLPIVTGVMVLRRVGFSKAW